MFPFYDNTADWDEYGEVINPDDYVIKDEDMDRGAMHVRSLKIWSLFGFRLALFYQRPTSPLLLTHHVVCVLVL